MSIVNPEIAPPRSLKVAVIGGGSGGHLVPAIAVADELLRRAPQSRFLFLISHRAVDQRIMKSAGLPTHSIDVRPCVHLESAHGIPGQMTVIPRMWGAFAFASRVLREFRPDVVVGVGALASVPGTLAARRLQLPIALMEQNAVPGRAVRMLARRAIVTMAGLPFDADLMTSWRSELVVAGTPIRRSIAALYDAPPVTSGRPRLLILGGSQGSQSVNRLMTAALADERCLPSDWQIVHQTGEAEVEKVASEYARHGRTATVISFLTDLPQQLAAATFVVSRSGAGTLQELACAGLPTILIPFSHAAANHQHVNATHYASAGAAAIVEETDEDAALLLRKLIQDFVAQPSLRQQYRERIRTFARPDSAAVCADILQRIAEK